MAPFWLAGVCSLALFVSCGVTALHENPGPPSPLMGDESDASRLQRKNAIRRPRGRGQPPPIPPREPIPPPVPQREPIPPAVPPRAPLPPQVPPRAPSPATPPRAPIPSGGPSPRSRRRAIRLQNKPQEEAAPPVPPRAPIPPSQREVVYASLDFGGRRPGPAPAPGDETPYAEIRRS
ncbi:hypothetical protein CSUI_008379 [Cystoisospora suis]|uniref:Transmembrane protein n=1 Tax=Cystoisospora suis TaxID=483139 RepID=A0A2C6KN28_9APIC|nr:hypothetical protein CSUI_008379 [Cystoisospora suis]